MQEKGEFVIYQNSDDHIKIDVRLEDETVWLTQEQMALLFGKVKSTINEHIKNIYLENELQGNETMRKFGNSEFSTKPTNFYNLDVIISVGYRVKSRQGTQFRIWATGRLKEYLIKGFALNDERFKSGSSMNYFNELQQRIREIRLSEKFFYQKIKDIYTTSIDYDSQDEKTILFFKKVQNKLLWAISRQTAAELVYRRVDASLPLLGMQSYDKGTGIKVGKSDVSIAKNYLAEDEIKLLGLLVEQYLAFAETMAQQHTPMYMADWIERLDSILQLNGRELLTHAGNISQQQARQKSAEEFARYKDHRQQIEREENLKEIEEEIKRLALDGGVNAKKIPRVLIETLGCKVNHYESQGLAAEFRRQGWQVVKKGPLEAVVINSCAVTAEAGRQSLQSARRALKRYPEARVALAGCAVVADLQKVAEVEKLGAIFGNAGKKDLVSRITRQLEKPAAVHPELVGIAGELGIDLLRADSKRGRSRAVVKIQDGCNSFCRYCIIPYLRGRCRSLPPEKVLAECRELVVAGFNEVVLTGIHIGRYGDDATADFSLTSLLLQLVDEFPDLRLRLGSLQPHEITPEIMTLLLDPQSPVCEHLHLSLQSASNRVLGAMGRPYRRHDIERIFARLADGRGRLSIGTDLIVGFPAENESAFLETMELVEMVDLAYLHVFPYSPRRGTVAASWPDRVSPVEKKERAAKLGALGRHKKDVFSRKNLGKDLKVLLETQVDDNRYGSGWFGHSRNYLPVQVTNQGENNCLRAGSEITIQAHDWDGRRLIAAGESFRDQELMDVD